MEEIEVLEVDLEYEEKKPSVSKILKEAQYWAALSSPDRNSNPPHNKKD